MEQQTREEDTEWRGRQEETQRDERGENKAGHRAQVRSVQRTQVKAKVRRGQVISRPLISAAVNQSVVWHLSVGGGGNIGRQ